MNKALLFICLFFPLASFAQLKGAEYKGADGVPRDFQINDGNGQPIAINDHSDIGGSPFLQDKWEFGIIKLINGNLLTDSLVNYSLADDKLYFKRNGKFYPINYTVKEFSIEKSEDSAEEKTYHFQNGFPAIARNTTTTFYEVLYAGDSLQLLRWKHKVIREINNYNTAIENQYIAIQEFFVFYPTENKMISLGNKINFKTIKKKMPVISDKIGTFTSNHKTNTGNEEDIIALFSLLDKSKH